MKTRIGAVLAGALLATTLSACSGVETNAGKETITFATTAGYDDTNAVTALWTALLDDRGYTVETSNVDLAAGFSGIARGNLDGYLNAWLPSTHQAFVDEYREDLVILDENGPFFDNNRLVLAVPESVEEKTIEDVVDNAEKYDSKIVGIEAGSGEMKLLPGVLETYGAQDKLDILEGSTPAALAALKGGVESNEPVVVALWTPHWAFSSMSIKALEDNKEGWPKPDGSYVVLSKKFAEAQPEVAKWLGNSKLTEEQFSSLMLAVSEADDPVAGARTWLETAENKAAVDKWFEGAN